MISEEQIKLIINKIINDYNPKKIILFGSYAIGNPTDDSDIDLLIVKDSNLPVIERNRLVRKLFKDYTYPIDIIVKTSDEFNKYKDIIGTVVYSASKYGKVIYG